MSDNYGSDLTTSEIKTIDPHRDPEFIDFGDFKIPIPVAPSESNFANLAGLPLAGDKRLAGRNLQWAECKETNCTGADLCKTNFSHAKLYKTRFPGADLRGAILNDTGCVYTNFKGAQFDETTSFLNARFGVTDFTGTPLALPETIRIPAQGMDIVDITEDIERKVPRLLPGVRNFEWFIQHNESTQVMVGCRRTVISRIYDTSGGYGSARSEAIVVDAIEPHGG